MRSWPLSITAFVFAISLGSAFAEDEAPMPDPNEPTAAADPSEPAAGDSADTSSASTDAAATDSDGK